MYFYFYRHHPLWQRLWQDIRRFLEYRNHVQSFCPYFYKTRKYCHRNIIAYHRILTSDSYLKFPSFCAPQSSSFDFICAIACGNGTPCSGSYDQTTVTPIIWQSKEFFCKISILSEKGNYLVIGSFGFSPSTPFGPVFRCPFDEIRMNSVSFNFWLILVETNSNHVLNLNRFWM